jgi:hypothetical protein
MSQSSTLAVYRRLMFAHGSACCALSGRADIATILQMTPSLAPTPQTFMAEIWIDSRNRLSQAQVASASGSSGALAATQAPSRALGRLRAHVTDVSTRRGKHAASLWPAQARFVMCLEFMFHLRTDLKQGFLMKVNPAPGSRIAFTLKVA